MSGPASSSAVARARALWDHPVGPKTVFFWGPIVKWCLVLAGLKDVQRPVEKLSVSQNVALAATGFIWTRWSLVIIPKNYPLAAVNFFVGCTGLYQLGRVYQFHRVSQDHTGSGSADATPSSPTAGAS